MAQAERYIFTVHWFDDESQLIRDFYLSYFPSNRTIELYDKKNKRMFLRRTPCDTVREKDLYLQNVVEVFSRKMTLVDYADEETRRNLERKNQRTVIVLKGSLWSVGMLLDICAADLGCVIAKCKSLGLDDRGLQFLQTIQKTERASSLTHLLDQQVIYVEVVGANTQIVREATKQLEGAEIILCETGEPSLLTLSTKMLSSIKTRTQIERSPNCSLGIIKPHAINDGLAGKILMDIDSAGFTVSEIDTFYLEYKQAEVFFNVYRGVVPEYQGMVTQLSSGPCIAMCVTMPSSTETDVHQEFRKLVGPANPEIARQLRPRTLRAMYGKDKLRNAIHCTDLAEDTLLEVRYFFDS